VGVRTGSFFLDLLLPQRCASCGLGESILCERCRAALHRLDGPLCARCGAPTAWPVARCAECAGRRLPFTTARAAVAYDGPVPALVAAWKERGLRALAAACAELVAATVPAPPVVALTYVPGERERVLWRGHNAGEALARLMGERWSLPVLPLLERTRSVPRQRGLSRSERRANVRGAFRASATPPSAVVLVDDVYTTGATVAAAVTELRRAGARAVHVVAFARAVRR
jgi:predicted amidophosphoribosyltransferase